MYFDIEVKIDIDRIFHSTNPYIELYFTVRSSFLREILIGDAISGNVSGEIDPNLGDTPKIIPSAGGKGNAIRIHRGRKETLKLQQVIDPKLRTRWGVRRIVQGQDIDVNLKFENLYISLQLLYPDSKERDGELIRLPIPNEAEGLLRKVRDWDWSQCEQLAAETMQ